MARNEPFGKKSWGQVAAGLEALASVWIAALTYILMPG